MFKEYYMKKMTKALSALFMLPLAASAMEFSAKLPENQLQYMKSDLDLLQNTNLVVRDAEEFGKVFGLENANTPMIQKWLEERVKYIVAEEFDYKKDTVELSGRLIAPNYVFPQMDPVKPKPADDKEEEQAAKKGITVMANMGAFVYLLNKFSFGSGAKALVFENESGEESLIPIDSPRIGLVQVGEGHFMERLQINKENLDASANGYQRLATLFHEGRHSDGNGKGLSFLHGNCPLGHYFEGVPACDKNLNGPYTVGAIILKTFVDSCEDCSDVEKEKMRLRFLDSYGRVVSTYEAFNEKNSQKIRMLEVRRQLLKTQIDSMKKRSPNPVLDNPMRVDAHSVFLKQYETQLTDLDAEIAELEKPVEFQSQDWDAEPEIGMIRESEPAQNEPEAETLEYD